MYERGPILRLLVLSLVVQATVAGAADHADTPLLQAINRSDARLTDIHAFLHDGNLVLALASDPAIPPSVTEYQYPADLTLRLYIDNDSEVSFEDPDDLARFGGTVVKPNKISEDIVFEVTFDGGEPRLRAKGIRKRDLDAVSFFAGLRDDPFIRAPRVGTNVAAVVLEIPLDLVLRRQSTLLIWATSDLPEVHGKIVEHAGLALRSQLPENDLMNVLRPKKHAMELGVAPDVIILDTASPVGFPNGRTLTDDVIDLVLGAPMGPSENDVPFLDEFPYLAEPHLPP